MTDLAAYFDAAGHPDGKHVLVVGGYVASAAAWVRFERGWNVCLRRAGIDVFHMADFMARRSGFESWTGRENDQDVLLRQLVDVVQKHVRHSFSTMVLLESWAEINRIYALEENHCTPYVIGGFFSIDKAMRWLNRRKKTTAITKFVFENGDKHKGDLMWMVDQITKFDRRILAPIRPQFMPKKVAALQAADFAMWEQFRAAKTRIDSDAPVVTWRPTLRRVSEIKHSWGFLDENKLIQFCEDFCVPKRGSGLAWTGPARGAVESRARDGK